MRANTTAPLSRTCKLALFLALLLQIVATLRPAAAANPCDPLPQACHYTWNPADRCCVADPRFDCYDVCF